MKLTALGKVVILLLALGFAIGGFRLWSKYKAQNAPTTITKKPNSKGDGGFKWPSLPKAGQEKENPPTSDSPNTPASTNELILVSSASKKGWLGDQIDKFNSQNSDSPVVLRTYETREAMHAILSGRVKPSLYSPSSFIWADRLSEVWRERNAGASLLDTSDDASYRTVLRSPIVFLTAKSKANFLRPLLGSANCWENIKTLSSGQKRAPWGQIKWAHADPLNANSGALTLSLILADYSEKSGQGGSIETVARSKGFANHLQAVERRFVYNTAVQKGSSALLKSFTEDSSRYDFITAYEATAIDAIKDNPDLAVIYPNPTVNAENSIAALDATWMSTEQKEAARKFVKFLASPEASSEGMKEYFRPVRGASLEGQVASLSENGLRQSYSTIELPPYDALNSAAVTWRTRVARK